MDCTTARLLLPFLNPRAEQLPEEVAAGLEAHANQCATCTALLQDSGREDRVIAVAMKDVPIPHGLHERLVAGLHREPVRRRRTWPLRHPRWSMAAAALLLCLAGAIGYWMQRPLPIDVEAFAEYSDQASYPEQADNLLSPLHLARPALFRYQFLISSAMEKFEDRLVPRLLFEGNAGQIAEVYILTNKKFDLAASYPKFPAGSGNFKIELRPDPNNPQVAYQIRYSGGPLDWLLVEANNGV
jgi:hypothetical protein